MELLVNNLLTSSDKARSRSDAEIRGMRENGESLYTQLEGAKEKKKEKEKEKSSSSSSSPPVIYKTHTTLPHDHQYHPSPNPPPRQPHAALRPRAPYPQHQNPPIVSSYDIRRSSSSAHPHPHPHQGLGLVAAQRTLVHARESCARQREDLELKHVRWEDAARRWQEKAQAEEDAARRLQEKAQAEAKWTRELLADLEGKGMSMSMRG